MLGWFIAQAVATTAPPAGSAPVAAPPPAAGSYLRAADHRVASVAYRLAARGRRFCPAHPVTGLAFHHLAEYAPRDRPEAIRRYGLDAGVGVLSVAEGSPAARAGLAAGDVLLSVNDSFFPSPATAAAEADEKKRRGLLDLAEGTLEEQLRLRPVRLRVSRAGRPLQVTLAPEQGCVARARLARSNQPNAFADGRYAVVTTKLLDFVRSDDELAIVLAHEFAHNILGHRARLEEQKVPKGILKHFGKNASRVLATEEEADRLGIKLVWAAGYDVSAAIPFWRRLYARYDPIPTPKLFRTHPGLGARERLIEETITELQAGGSKPGAERPEFGEGALRQR